VLTWWEGAADNQGVGKGVGYIADRDYHVIATVRSPSAALDLHEFRLTPRGTVLCVVGRTVPYDLTPFGGAANGTLNDDGFQEIDVASGRVVREWWASDHVPVSETYGRLDQTKTKLSFFHLNSVALDTDGDYLVSGRETWTVYKVDRRTGRIVWRLGGRDSDFTMGAGASFAWQHDAEAVGGGTYRILDNETMTPTPDAPESRVIWVRVDPRRHTATLQRALTYPGGISDPAEGGSQALPNRDTLVSWGGAGRVSEFGPGGRLLFDLELPLYHSTYRAYRIPWHARPRENPVVTVAADGTTVHAMWNGATDVARWRILGGDTTRGLRPVAEVPWNGYDTAAALPVHAAYLRVQALDRYGKIMATSTVTVNPSAGPPAQG
jgi:arylsulfotransferase ASST